VKTDYSGYAGYVRVTQSSAPLTIYAILAGQPEEACLLATLTECPR